MPRMARSESPIHSHCSRPRDWPRRVLRESMFRWPQNQGVLFGHKKPDVMICECFQCFRCFVGAEHFAFLDKHPPVWCMSNLEIHETGFLIWKIKQLRSWNWNYTHYSKKKYRVKSSETEAPSKSFSAGEIVSWFFPLSPPVQWWHWACPRRALPFDPTSMRAKVETLKHNKATKQQTQKNDNMKFGIRFKKIMLNHTESSICWTL